MSHRSPSDHRHRTRLDLVLNNKFQGANFRSRYSSPEVRRPVTELFLSPPPPQLLAVQDLPNLHHRMFYYHCILLSDISEISSDATAAILSQKVIDSFFSNLAQQLPSPIQFHTTAYNSTPLQFLKISWISSLLSSHPMPLQFQVRTS
jgi:hypothetical protein